MSAPKRLLAIINPISGTKDKEEIPALIRGGNRPFEISGGMCFYTVCGAWSRIDSPGRGRTCGHRAVRRRRQDLQRNSPGAYRYFHGIGYRSGRFGQWACPPFGYIDGRAKSSRNYQRRADRGFGLLYGKRSPFFLHLRGRLRCIGELEIRTKENAEEKIVVCGLRLLRVSQI